MRCYLGIDSGSVSTNLVLLNDAEEVLFKYYLRTNGQPLAALRQGLRLLRQEMEPGLDIVAAATTGSARQLIGKVIAADLIKNEITAHAAAAVQQVKGVRTVLEIGGQDSKLILLENGIAVDFAMNSVCAAGTGSFLDQQAARLCIPIEAFGDLTLQAKHPVKIAGRCAVFAESDMIHKQQVGHSIPDILAGLCDALVRNYLSNLAQGKKLEGPIAFQGGVAANEGMRQAFAKALQQPVLVPRYYDVMGALGAALLARRKITGAASESAAGVAHKVPATAGRGGSRHLSRYELASLGKEYRADSFECAECPNCCEVVKLSADGQPIACWNDRCGRWSSGELT